MLTGRSRSSGTALSAVTAAAARRARHAAPRLWAGSSQYSGGSADAFLARRGGDVRSPGSGRYGSARKVHSYRYRVTNGIRRVSASSSSSRGVPGRRRTAARSPVTFRPQSSDHDVGDLRDRLTVQCFVLRVETTEGLPVVHPRPQGVIDPAVPGSIDRHHAGIHPAGIPPGDDRRRWVDPVGRVAELVQGEIDQQIQTREPDPLVLSRRPDRGVIGGRWRVGPSVSEVARGFRLVREEAAGRRGFGGERSGGADSPARIGWVHRARSRGAVLTLRPWSGRRKGVGLRCSGHTTARTQVRSFGCARAERRRSSERALCPTWLRSRLSDRGYRDHADASSHNARLCESTTR